MNPPLSKTQIWSAPVALGLISCVGLLAALLSDGIGDAVSWVALAIPVAVAARYGASAVRSRQ